MLFPVWIVKYTILGNSAQSVVRIDKNCLLSGAECPYEMTSGIMRRHVSFGGENFSGGIPLVISACFLLYDCCDPG